MAKIIATYDSETKEMEVTIDGKKEDNVTHFSCYSNCCEMEEDNDEQEKYGGCSIEKRKTEENGVKRYESAYAHTQTDREKLELYFRNSLSKK